MNSGQNDKLQAAVGHFQAGRLAEAKELCAATLAEDGRNIMALHLFGILHCQEGDVARGAELLHTAVLAP